MQVDKARSESVFYCVMFLVVGICVGAAFFLQIALFTIAGEKLTARMRRQVSFNCKLLFVSKNSLIKVLFQDGFLCNVEARNGMVRLTCQWDWRSVLQTFCRCKCNTRSKPIFVLSLVVKVVVTFIYFWQAVGSRGGAICQSVFTIVLAISAGIYHEWKLGMVGSSIEYYAVAGH